MKILLTIFLVLTALFFGGCSLAFLTGGLFQSFDAPYTGLNYIYPIILAGLAIAVMAIFAIKTAADLRKATKAGHPISRKKVTALAVLVALITPPVTVCVTLSVFGGMIQNGISWLIPLVAAAVTGFGTYRLFSPPPETPKP